MTSYSVSTDLCGSHRYSLMSSLLVKMPGSWSKGCEFEFRHEWWENVLLQSQFCVLTLIWCLFHPHVTPVAHKEPGHSAKSAGGRLHLDTHTPLTQQSWSGMTMLLSWSSTALKNARHASLALSKTVPFICVFTSGNRKSRRGRALMNTVGMAAAAPCSH